MARREEGTSLWEVNKAEIYYISIICNRTPKISHIAAKSGIS